MISSRVRSDEKVLIAPKQILLANKKAAEQAAAFLFDCIQSAIKTYFIIGAQEGTRTPTMLLAST
jgi:hypothetical protein